MKRPIFSHQEWHVFLCNMRWGAALALLGIAGLMTVALISYDMSDPGVYTATWRASSNWLGVGGAFAADFLMRMLGVSSFLFIIIALVWALQLLSEKKAQISWVQIVSIPPTIIIIAAFASSYPSSANFGAGHGGMIGDLVFGIIAYSLPVFDHKIRLIIATVFVTLLAAPLIALVIGWRLVHFKHIAADLIMHWRILVEKLLHPAPAVAGHTVFKAPSVWQVGQNKAPLAVAPVAPSSKAPSAVVSEPKSEPEPAKPTSLSSVRQVLTHIEPDLKHPVEAESIALTSTQDHSDSTCVDRLDSASEPLKQNNNAEKSVDNSENLVDNHLGTEVQTSLALESAASSLEDSTVFDQSKTSTQLSLLKDNSEEKSLIDLMETKNDALTTQQQKSLEQTITESDLISENEEESVDNFVDQAYAPPPLRLLSNPQSDEDIHITEQALAEQADRLQGVLNDYGVRGEIIDVNPGPVVSQFELEPAPGLKASRVIGLADDIARSMSAVAARVSTIPGRNIIGIELPNAKRETVMLRPLFEDPSFTNTEAKLPLALGRDIAGEPVVADLATMPHLLVAGTTGSGKSVAINTMILSLLYQRTPEECRLILIDPKMLELSVYNNTPHLLAPVVTDPKKAVLSLRWVVREMERRYQLMAQLNVRSVDSFNQKIAEAKASGQSFERPVAVGIDPDTKEPIYEMQPMALENLPLIVVIIDEMADLMLVAGKEIEHCIQRLAQMARASGIHLIMATQRPSVDVITGVIKANFPIRISFQVTSKIDSRTILGEAGAEQLLGKGDMLFTAGGGRLQRIHGPFASDLDVEAVAEHLKQYGSAADLVSFEDPENLETTEEESEPGTEEETSDEALYERAVRMVAHERRASVSFIQRRLKVGYNRSARIVELMERNGVVGPANHVGKREVLIAPID